MSFSLQRHSIAARCAGYACLCAAALVMLPKGFVVYAALLGTITLLIPDDLAGAAKTAWPELRRTLLLVGLLLALTLVSMQLSGQEWNAMDNVVRFVLMPWSVVMVFTLRPSLNWLWAGAIVGVVIAFTIAGWQFWSGIDRVGAGKNPIVFANAVLALLVVVVFCRPVDDRIGVLPVMLVAVAVVLGILTILLSGSRGVLPGLVALLLVALVADSGQRLWRQLGILVASIAAALVVLWSVPSFALLARLDDIYSDVVRYAAGDVDTSLGTRLEFLALAWHAFLERPWTGVGLDNFHVLVQGSTHCQAAQLKLCRLGHAHNDLAQWAATLGLPGLLIIGAIYLLPLVQFARIIRRQPPRNAVGAAWAGVMLVLTYILSGLTQSMFSHALSTMIYAVFVGLLLGLAMGESPPPATDTR